MKCAYETHKNQIFLYSVIHIVQIIEFSAKTTAAKWGLVFVFNILFKFYYDDILYNSVFRFLEPIIYCYRSWLIIPSRRGHIFSCSFTAVSCAHCFCTHRFPEGQRSAVGCVSGFHRQSIAGNACCTHSLSCSHSLSLFSYHTTWRNCSSHNCPFFMTV